MKALVIAATMLLAANVYADCTLNPRTDTNGPTKPGAIFTVSWDAVPGATLYELRRSGIVSQAGVATPQSFVSATSFFTPFTSTNDQILTTGDGVINYEVRAIAGTTVLCSQPFIVDVQSDAATRNAFSRVVVPVAGSLTGANGAVFKTALTLTVPPGASNATPYTGKIIFHPSGVVSDGDPSMAYSIAPDTIALKQLHFDDVVAAMGQHGLGTLDVVPDASSQHIAPTVQARVYTPEQLNTFTGLEDGVSAQTATAFVVKNRIPTMSFTMPDATSDRVSVGFRTFGSDPVIADINIFPPDAPFQHTTLLLAPNSFQQIGIDALAKFHLAGGETVRITFTNANVSSAGLSAVLPYYSITNNVTNDLSIFVGAQSPQPVDVSPGLTR